MVDFQPNGVFDALHERQIMIVELAEHAHWVQPAAGSDAEEAAHDPVVILKTILLHRLEVVVADDGHEVVRVSGDVDLVPEVTALERRFINGDEAIVIAWDIRLLIRKINIDVFILFGLHTCLI